MSSAPSAATTFVLFHTSIAALSLLVLTVVWTSLIDGAPYDGDVVFWCKGDSL